MAKTKSNAELQAELRVLRQTRNLDGWVAIGREAVKWIGLCYISTMIYFSIAAMAGKMTVAEINAELSGKVDISIYIAWMVGVAGVVYGRVQRTLRRDTVERLQHRNVMLEAELDQRRSSSRLTPRGDTRPEDRP